MIAINYLDYDLCIARSITACKLSVCSTKTLRIVNHRQSTGSSSYHLTYGRITVPSIRRTGAQPPLSGCSGNGNRAASSSFTSITESGGFSCPKTAVSDFWTTREDLFGVVAEDVLLLNPEIIACQIQGDVCSMPDR